MTAAEMYKAATDARRNMVYGKIKGAAATGEFSVRVYYRDALNHVEDVLDELEKNGFRVDRSNSDFVVVSWENAGSSNQQ